jgi:hypothetical protein
MKRIVTIATLALLMGILPMTAQAQTWGAPDYMKGKLVTGGQIGAGFSGNTLHLGIAPQLGFRPIRSLEVGIRLGYDLDYHFRSYYNPYSVCYHYFSGAIYANYEIFRGHRHEFVIGGEVILEVYHVAFERVGVAEKYEFHCFSWLGLMIYFKISYFRSILSFFGVA